MRWLRTGSKLNSFPINFPAIRIFNFHYRNYGADQHLPSLTIRYVLCSRKMSQACLMSNLDAEFPWGVLNAMYLNCAWAMLDGSLLILVALYIFISFIKWPICLIFFTDNFFVLIFVKTKRKGSVFSSQPILSIPMDGWQRIRRIERSFVLRCVNKQKFGNNFNGSITST